MTDQSEALISCAKRLFPLAALYLGSLSGGRAAVTETIAAVRKRSPESWESEVLPRLLRTCQTRAAERSTPDFPDDAELAALLPVLKLPPGSRCSLALSLCDIPPEEAAAARGITPETLAQNTEKAIRQLKFTRGGEAPDTETLREALRHLPWHDSDTEALLAAAAIPEGDAPAEQDAAPIAGEIRKITRQDHGAGRTVSVPLWGMLAVLAGVLLIFGILLYFAARNPRPAPMQDPPAHADFEPEEIRRFQDYLTLPEAQQKAAEFTKQPEKSLVFLSTKLKPAEQPPRYEIVLYVPGGQQHEYALDAKTGTLISDSNVKAEPIQHIETWIPAEKMRQAALRCTGLTDVLFLKEKLSTGGDAGSYKYELLDGEGVVYAMEFDAVTGMLMKYSAESPAPEQVGNIIPPERAKQQALVRAGNPDPDKVIFTKVKQDGNVYLIAFTLDDGTQYLMELNAVTGSINTVDVSPVSADISGAIGVIEAAKRAESMAGLMKTQPVEYTKAKIERSNGAYVYELEFETEAFEYEASVNTVTGAMIKYRAIAK
ncbi:MAG: PepSY domain-containing protein [Oscillospiraceae bacterium]|nr:PepSY domain-containing protein [Oscillospiraceae bacterium]